MRHKILVKRRPEGDYAVRKPVHNGPLHPPKGDTAGHWSVKVNRNWRVTFKFARTDAVAVDYTD